MTGKSGITDFWRITAQYMLMDNLYPLFLARYVRIQGWFARGRPYMKMTGWNWRATGKSISILWYGQGMYFVLQKMTNIDIICRTW